MSFLGARYWSRSSVGETGDLWLKLRAKQGQIESRVLVVMVGVKQGSIPRRDSKWDSVWSKVGGGVGGTTECKDGGAATPVDGADTGNVLKTADADADWRGTGAGEGGVAVGNESEEAVEAPNEGEEEVGAEAGNEGEEGVGTADALETAPLSTSIGTVTSFSACRAELRAGSPASLRFRVRGTFSLGTLPEDALRLANAALWHAMLRSRYSSNVKLSSWLPAEGLLGPAFRKNGYRLTASPGGSVRALWRCRIVLLQPILKLMRTAIFVLRGSQIGNAKTGGREGVGM
ncbi:hypothetical protein B0H13DRAFT_1906649 [Mycena leptocephala]|nr:hypothetical protein B0H13DRAFT_1906649 [Mycena leptocephala]